MADVSWEPLELIEAPGDRVLTLTRQSGPGRESGVPAEIELSQLWTIRDRNVREIELFLDPADALAAAGLSE